MSAQGTIACFACLSGAVMAWKWRAGKLQHYDPNKMQANTILDIQAFNAN